MGLFAKLREELRTHRYSFLISLVVTLLGVGVYVGRYWMELDWAPLAFLDSVELKSYDARFRLRGRIEPSPQIVIAAIDQKTVDELGAWPFPRIHYVRMLDHLAADGAKVIGFDIAFPKPDDKSGLQALQRARKEYLTHTPTARRNPAYLERLATLEREADADRQFAEALRRAGTVVLGQFFFFDRSEIGHLHPETQQAYESLLAFGAYPAVRPLTKGGRRVPPLAELPVVEQAQLPQPNLPLFAEAVDYTFGFFNFFADADSLFRHTNLVIRYNDDFYPSLDVQMLRRYLAVPDQKVGLFYNEAGVEYVQVGELQIPTDPDGRILIHYQGPERTYPHYSFSDLVQDLVPRGTFTGKMVLVGATAKGIADIRPVPVQEASFTGVEIHANVLETLLTRRFIERGLRQQAIDLGFILLFGLGLGWVLARVRPLWSTPLTALVLAAFLLVTYVALIWFQSWLNLVVPALVLATNFALVSSFRFLVEEREKRKTRTAFTQYVPPGVVRELMKNPGRLQLGGEERELTIMFSDIRGFTTLSEKLSPLELTHFLNAYTDEMTDILFRHWGTLDKFEGDAIMAFWGAPYEQDDHPLRACNTALEMRQRVDALRQQWRDEGKPDINVGMGVNTGRVVVGNMGSRKRFNYTVLGDPVNLASRLEGVNKEYGTRILVSEFTYLQASTPMRILEQRVAKELGASADALVGRDGSTALQQARLLALYVAHRQRLAVPRVLAQRYGGFAETQLPEVLAQAEQCLSRDKRWARLAAEAERSLRPLVFRRLDWIRVKGRREPVAIYELVDHGGDSDRWADLLTIFEGGLEAYRNRRWQFAIDLFQTILERYPEDAPSHLFIERCQRYLRDEPEPAWDGVYVMERK